MSDHNDIDSPIAVLSESIKICKQCGATKPETAFHSRGPGKGRKPVCAECRNKSRKKRQETPQQRLERKLWEEYRLTLTQYLALADAQGGVCVICRRAPNGGTRLYVDHCHTTGVVRALLCNPCNLMIGVYENHHRTATEYLAVYGAGNPLLITPGTPSARIDEPPS
ncbi:endonuclease VII domain-containing protein [Streptomyces sparsogenes]|uniref:Endonuclease VII n=1 Tax=Streptomyces sparsogenes DSM 40356 TaxID=1331668 RepID=A0A1R1S893_9ACTN|nr:endonuclease VII domain-containing protein [Streptomyces sparsogenes]OMI34457.1 endonuclease VII [Streptomyces sparsogenes DSM 40356]